MSTNSRCIFIAGLLFTLIALSGCASNFRGSAREQSVGPGRMTASKIQSEVMSFTDSFNAAERTGQTVDRMTKLVERIEILLASPSRCRIGA